MAGEEVRDRHDVIVVIARTDIIAYGYDAVLREAGVRDDAALDRFPEPWSTTLMMDRKVCIRCIAWAVIVLTSDKNVRLVKNCTQPNG